MRRALWVIALIAVGALSFWGYRAWAQSRAGHGGGAGALGGQGSNAGAQPPERPTVVEVATVERHDVPVYLEGIGNVAAFYKATVHPQVTGVLTSVQFREGQAVHRGDVLAQVDPRPFAIALRQAQAVLARDRAQLQSNQLALERDRQLRERNFVAPQEFDNQRAMVEQLRASIRGDEASIASARLQLSYARVVAPIDGVTGVRQVDPGNLVTANDANGIVVITQVDPVAVFFSLPEDVLPRITAEIAHGALPVEAFSRDGETRLGAGELSVIDNQIDPGTATIRLKAVMPNPAHALWPEQFVKVRMLLTTRRGVLTVPASAVQRGPRGTVVYVVGGDHRVALRPVRVSSIEGEVALIDGGLAVGESVVTDGQTRLRPGAAVDPHPVGNSPAESQSGSPSGSRRGAGVHRDGGADS